MKAGPIRTGRRKFVAVSDTVHLRPVTGLVHRLHIAEIETLTVNAIRRHRLLLANADSLFQALPDNYRTGKEAGGTQHLEYIEKMIEMHAQMGVVSTLTGILGYIPKVPLD